MKPAPMSDIEILKHVNCLVREAPHYVKFTQAIIAARDAQWEEMLSKREPVAALVEVRRTDGPWQRYNEYASVAVAEDTKARTDGNGIEVRVVPLYREPTE